MYVRKTEQVLHMKMRRKIETIALKKRVLESQIWWGGWVLDVSEKKSIEDAKEKIF
jgi:hypothetical protein